MKYWKQGFYDEPQEDSVKLEDEYWQELLQGQSSGKEIKENEQGYPILTTHQVTLNELKASKISEIQTYDKSNVVNQFFINGAPLWLDKEMRVGLMNSINIEKSAGRVETNLWFGGIQFIFPIDSALGMLYALELYALECYNVTQQHIATINTLTTKNEVGTYNFKTGYPDKLNF